MTLPPLSLYLHLPWCVRKCPYCDFNSHTAGDAPPKRRYLDALLADLDGEADIAGGRTLETVFLGGGTPSLFTPAEIGELLQGIAARFALAADAEVTMEANPGTVDCGDPAGYRDAGVNRLSIGAQSFDATALDRLGRIHSPGDIEQAVAAARDAGFENLNIDLMHGLPGQTVAAALADIDAALALGPAHVSWYQLTLEPNTVFHARPPQDLPDEDTLAAIHEAGTTRLAAAGFGQYEVSAWSRDGRRCRHNLNYWEFGDYLAAGAGAHGKVSGTAGVCRYRKPAHPRAYMEAVERGETVPREPVAAADLVFEFMLNALRLSGGFTTTLFCARTGLPADVLDDAAAAAVSRGLLECLPGGRWRPTARGRRFLDDTQATFLPT